MTAQLSWRKAGSCPELCPAKTRGAGNSCPERKGAALGQHRVQPGFHPALGPVNKVMLIFTFSCCKNACEFKKIFGVFLSVCLKKTFEVMPAPRWDGGAPTPAGAPQGSCWGCELSVSKVCWGDQHHSSREREREGTKPWGRAELPACTR